VLDEGADHGGVDIEADDALVSETDFFGGSLHFLGHLAAEAHPQTYQLPLPIFLNGQNMVIFGIFLDIDIRAVKLISFEFMYLLYLMFEISIFLLAEHVFHFIVEFFLSIFLIDFENISI
jgi:hypothetical protein